VFGAKETAKYKIQPSGTRIQAKHDKNKPEVCLESKQIRQFSRQHRQHMFIGNIRYAHHYADKGKKKIVKKDTMIQKKNALKP
jgi:hypothetical protein